MAPSTCRQVDLFEFVFECELSTPLIRGRGAIEECARAEAAEHRRLAATLNSRAVALVRTPDDRARFGQRTCGIARSRGRCGDEYQPPQGLGQVRIAEALRDHLPELHNSGDMPFPRHTFERVHRAPQTQALSRSRGRAACSTQARHSARPVRSPVRRCARRYRRCRRRGPRIRRCATRRALRCRATAPRRGLPWRSGSLAAGRRTSRGSRRPRCSPRDLESGPVATGQWRRAHQAAHASHDPPTLRRGASSPRCR